MQLCRFFLYVDALHVMAFFSLALFLTAFAQGAARGDDISVVSNVKVVSDKVEDVSSIDAWKEAVITPGMTDEEKALAIWRTAVRFRHQNAPPLEFLQDEDYCVHDIIKTANVYGYGMCCCAASNIEALARAAGLPVRARALHGHSLPEIFYDGDWHMFDASLVTWFRDSGGSAASIDEILKNVADWYAAHPDIKGDDKKLRSYMRARGWKNGPSILADTDYIDADGWFPAGTHGWYAPMSEFDGSVNDPCEFGYSQGYSVNVQLRPGIVLTRNWSNKGLHVNSDQPAAEYALTSLTGEIGKGEFAYAADFGDIAPGRIGNGTLAYNVPLAGGRAKIAPLTWDNLASAAEDGLSPALRVKSPASPGILTLRMPSPYVYLSGAARCSFVVGKGGSVTVSVSVNNGLDYTPVYHISTPGPQSAAIDLTPSVYRLYDYRVRFDLAGAGTGIDALAIVHDIQHSQRALPALGPYENQITFSSAAQEGTVTIEGLPQPQGRHNQLSILDYHPVLEGVECTRQGLELRADGGTVTFSVETPGDMVRLRFGCYTMAATDADGWYLLVSFDEGASWQRAGRVTGAAPGVSGYVIYGDVPAGTRSALVRYAGGRGESAVIKSLRVDADYAEPDGGFKPVKITYVWEELGIEKRDIHVAASPRETYTIVCPDKPILAPVMKSLIVELAE